MIKLKAGTALFLIVVTLFVAAGCRDDGFPSAHHLPNADRTYILEALMTGYVGVGGEIDGIRNPVLHAYRGETVALVIVNGEKMIHDIALRRHRARSDTILEEGAMTHITFTAENDDTYYCTIPGHLEAGMAGEFFLIEEPAASSTADCCSKDGPARPPEDISSL